jgi:hypothetical protein
MYEQTGMNQDDRDQMIYLLWRKRVSYAKIAKKVGVSIGAVRGSLTRTAQQMTGLRDGSRRVHRPTPPHSENW